jgi:hypothetical protein
MLQVIFSGECCSSVFVPEREVTGGLIKLDNVSFLIRAIKERRT